MVLALPFEIQLILFLQNIIAGNDVLIGLFVLFTQLGDVTLIGLIISFLYLAYDKEKGIDMALALTAVQIFNGMIKNVFLRVRPYAAHRQISCLHPVEPEYDIYDLDHQGYSFPSGHATNVSAAVTFLWKQLQGRKYLGIIAIFLTALSRVVLGVHYPSDVLFGMLLGLAGTHSVMSIEKRWGRDRAFLILLVMSLPGIFYCRSDDYFSSIGLFAGFALGQLFERRHVGFRNTRDPIKTILRTLIGGLLLLGVSNALKLPFDKEFLEADSLISHLYRSFRYLCGAFAVTGLLPILLKCNILKIDDKMKEDEHADNLG